MVATVTSGTPPRVGGVDDHLKLMAEAGLALTEAEEALDADQRTQAADAIDRAGGYLATLRISWANMAPAEQAIVGTTARPLRGRLDAATRRLRPRSALSQGVPEPDPEQDVDPAAEAA
jgi:hypothetical protein